MVSRSLLFPAISLFFLVLMKQGMFGQTSILSLDSSLKVIFSTNLEAIPSSQIPFKKRPLVVISNMSCSGCVEYFTSNKKDFVFLFLLQNESLLEINQIIQKHKLQKSSVYFSMAESVFDSLSSGPSPKIIYASGTNFILLDYSKVSEITKGFSIKHSKFIKNLKVQTN